MILKDETKINFFGEENNERQGKKYQNLMSILNTLKEMSTKIL